MIVRKYVERKDNSLNNRVAMYSIAKKMGVSQSYISKIFSNKVKISEEQFNKIADTVILLETEDAERRYKLGGIRIKP